MLSAPPASAKSASPMASACTAEAIACAPEPQRRLTFIAGTVSGTPASIAATRLRYMSRGSVATTCAEDHVPDLAALDARPLERRARRQRRQRDRRDRRQAAAEGADGGARAIENHDVLVHGRSSRV